MRSCPLLTQQVLRLTSKLCFQDPLTWRQQELNLGPSACEAQELQLQCNNTVVSSGNGHPLGKEMRKIDGGIFVHCCQIDMLSELLSISCCSAKGACVWCFFNAFDFFNAYDLLPRSLTAVLLLSFSCFYFFLKQALVAPLISPSNQGQKHISYFSVGCSNFSLLF